MQLIRCTQKLLKQLDRPLVGEGPGITPVTFTGSEGSGLLGGWHANLLMIDRQKCVLFTNNKTLFSFLVPGVKKHGFQNFEILFMDGLTTTLKQEGYAPEQIRTLLAEYSAIGFAKTNNRIVLGSMNELRYHIEPVLFEAGGLQHVDISLLNHRINRIIMSAIEPFHHSVDALRAALDPGTGTGTGAGTGAGTRTVSTPLKGPAKSPNYLLQFRIELLGIRPPVWRRIQIPESYTLWDFHVAIQDAMGWKDYHLHAFQSVGSEAVYGIPEDEESNDVLSCHETKVQDVFHFVKPVGTYEYDFGDSWVHLIVFEGAESAVSRGRPRPRCLDGARKCPPEDCGGPDQYQDLLIAIRDPSHPEHESMLEWLGKSFDPEDFSRTKVRFDDPRKRWLKRGSFL